MANGGLKSAYLGWLAGAMATEVEDVRPNTTGAATRGGDLVLGYATGYDASLIAPFVRSLRAVFDGSVALVVDDRPDVLALLAEHHVEAVHPQAVSGWRPHPVMARFPAFLQLLDRYADVGSVLITDVRDVVFQAAPFAPAPTRLEVFVENEGKSLGQHAFDMKYLAALVGQDMAAGVADKPCLCVGTVMGPRQDVARFCRVVMMLAAIPRSEMGGAFGADQAACNLAVHLGLIEADIRPNFGRVATIGLTPGEQLSYRDGRVVNPDGSASAVVHQHDRHPHLDDAVFALWGQGMRQGVRVKPRSAGDRVSKLGQSIMRRLPEWR